jgi:L-ribulose-5-phosphate 3-epimerase
MVTWSQLAHRFPFDLCLVAGEVGDDWERTLAVARELDIRQIEFGALWGEQIQRVSLERLVRARDLLRSYGVRARMVAPEAFKAVRLDKVPLEGIDQEPHFQREMQLFRASLAAARFFDAPLVRVFSFRRVGMVGLGNPSPRHAEGGAFPAEMQEKVAHALRLACREAEQAGVTLTLENVRSCWGNGGLNTAQILERVDSSWLRVIWDPANAFVSGERPFPDGYRAVQPHTAHVHLKDAVVVDDASGLTRWERIGEGGAGLEVQLAALRDDGYAGCVSIETHWSPPGGDRESNTRRTYEGLMALLERI